MKEPLVIYIIGDNRSGSTLLDYLLSCHPDAVSVGELHHLNDYYFKKGVGMRTDWKCGCGNQIKECSFWMQVLQKIQFSESYVTRLKLNKSKRINRLFSTKKNFIETLAEREERKEFAHNQWELYKAIFAETKQKIIIDSSKSPYEAFTLNEFKQGKIKFIFLKRNIWEVAYSSNNRMKSFSNDFIEYMNLKESSIYKTIFNTYTIFKTNQYVSELINKSTDQSVKEVEYIELTTNVKDSIASICSFLDLEYFDPPLRTNLGLKEDHIIHGSPSRGDSKTIKPDMRWESYYSNKPIALLLGKILQRI